MRQEEQHVSRPLHLTSRLGIALAASCGVEGRQCMSTLLTGFEKTIENDKRCRLMTTRKSESFPQMKMQAYTQQV
jgi:hypothetical protein